MARISPHRRRISEASSLLPEDMVGEILSWLPVESLLRFKCVCKNWYQLIQEDDFVEKHHCRAAICFYYHQKYKNNKTPPMDREWQIHPIRKDAEFSCIDIQKGLLLEHERSKDPTERLRIRNPATRQTVYLPDLRVGDEPPTWVVARMFFVGNKCTVISFSESEESVLFGRFRALTVGVDSTWRPLKNSPPNSIHFIGNSREPKIYALSIEKVFHVVIMDGGDKKILWVDAEDESIKTAKIPENIFGFYLTPIEWNSKLALFFEDEWIDEIYIWVLMNYNKNEWAKIQFGDLATFFQDCRPTQEVIWSPEEIVSVPWRKKDELSIKPTVLQLTGMQSDKVEEAIGARFWKEEGDMPKTTSQTISAISLQLKSVM